ncbi:MAG: hypothetical protein AB1Z98_37265 [Nannocystaceae bacterium]
MTHVQPRLLFLRRKRIDWLVGFVFAALVLISPDARSATRGGDPIRDVVFDEPTVEEAAEGSTRPDPAAESPVRMTGVAPLDFCRLEPKTDDDAYQVQRVIMLDLGEDPSLEDGSEVELVKRGDQVVEVPRTIFQEIEPFGHAREVLLSVFPMKRHYLLLAKPTPNDLLSAKDDISLERARSMMGDDRLARYSVDCTDWIVAPYLSRGAGRWTTVKSEKVVVDAHGTQQRVEYEAWSLDVSFDVRLEVYRRDEDLFVHHATLEGTNSSLRAATHKNARAMADGSWDDIKSNVSAWLPPSCPVPTSPAGFSDCGGLEVSFSVDGPSAMGTGQSHGPYCEDLDDSVERGEQGMRDVARCVLRRQVENVTQEVQLEAKKMCGWRLFSSLLPVPSGHRRGVSMGKEEGARRGDYYIARKGTSADEAQCVEGEEIGFARIIKLGPGGESGKTTPSEVRFRTAGVPLGTHMTEYAMHGARLGAEPTLGFMLVKGDLEGTIVGGATLRLGYDLSRFVPFLDEAWSVGGFGYLRGGNRETFLTYDVGFEVDKYAWKRLAFFASLGLGGTSALKKVPNAALGGDEDILLQGGVFAMYLRTGPEVIIRPDWHLRFALELRTGFNRAILDNEEAPEQTINGGPLLGLSTALSVAHTF